MNKLKLLSLFSGVGGLDKLFMESDNFDVIGFSEIDNHASAVLKYHHEHIKNYGSIVNCDSWDIDSPDIIIGGFPCQGISTQGTQTGLKHDKTVLFNYIPTIIKKHKPKFILLENVKNLLSKQMAVDYAYIRKSIEELGYTIKVRLQDSSYYGTPQQRIRVFMLCVRKDIKQNGESDSLYVRSKRFKIKTNEASRLVSYSKSTRKTHTDYRIREDGLVNTLTTGYGCKGASTGSMVVGQNKASPMSPELCEKLMTWNSGHTKYGIMGSNKIIIPDSARYKMIGNGVVSNCVYPIIKEIELML